MNYTLTPSLKHIALVKIVTTLWNQDDIRVLIRKFWSALRGNGRKEEWKNIEDKVVEKVPHLPQPKYLKEEILGFIKPVGIQIFKWTEYHWESFINVDLPNELCWTPQGTVDKKKTAEILIKDESLYLTTRYKLACIYCLEDDILELWNKMPENHRKSFYDEEDPIKVWQQELVVLWTYDIKGEVARMNNRIELKCECICSPYQYAFRYAAVGGNKEATEYFLQKLTPRERAESLVRSIGYKANVRGPAGIVTGYLPEYNADVVCFLLSQMDEEQQIEVFKSNPYKVLRYLLDWPWQILFMETANRMWDFLSEEDCYGLLSISSDKLAYGYKDCNYQKLLGGFWKQSPGANKRYV